MMLARDQSQTRGQGGAPRCGMGSSRASTVNHHKSSPARRDLHARNSGRGAKARLGFFFPVGQVAEFFAYRSAGLTDPVALAAVDFVTPQREIPAADPVHHVRQDNADVPEVVHAVRLSKSVASNDLEATDGENGRVPNHRGKLPDQRGELPNVGDC